MAAQLGPSLCQLKRGLSVVQPNRDLVIMETNALSDYQNVSRHLVKTNAFFIVRIRQLVACKTENTPWEFFEAVGRTFQELFGRI